MMNTTTTKLLWLPGLAMAVSAISGVTALSSVHGITGEMAGWIESQCTGYRMQGSCGADLFMDFASYAAVAQTKDTGAEMSPVAEIWEHARRLHPAGKQ
jgi:hypothetical protein